MTSAPLPDRVRDREDLEALLARATNYEELKPRSKERPVFKLERVREMLAAVGDPQRGPRTVHVAGSKGKGTVARMVAAALRASGAGPVGLYTSPHLEDLRERIVVDGEEATDAELAEAADRLLPHVRRVHGTPRGVTFFELLTGMAWLVFRGRGCQHVVLETGLGGRLDATNVCAPSVVLVTAIELEHTEVLGSTVEAIAAEKAGILKPGVPAATTAEGRALEVLEAHATEVGTSLAAVGREIHVEGARTAPGPETRFRLRLPGEAVARDVRLAVAGVHHAGNAALAAWACRELGLAPDTVQHALGTLRLPGIVEPLGGAPLVVVDGAHTPTSARCTREAVAACWPGRAPVLLVALLAGKDVEGIVRSLLPGAAGVVVTHLPTPRALAAHELAQRVGTLATCPTWVEEEPTEALRRARAEAGPKGLVLATGSVRIAGLVRTLVGHSTPYTSER